MATWQQLMTDFDLESQVRKFVLDKVAELLADEKHSFSFEGGKRYCSNDRPHVPHVIDHYSTVRYGTLQHFCLGRSGDGVGDPVIVVRTFDNGDAAYPGYARGYWYIRK